jgi:hypothetical protein
MFVIAVVKSGDRSQTISQFLTDDQELAPIAPSRQNWLQLDGLHKNDALKWARTHFYF